MKIKVLVKTNGCSPVIFKQGDFIDLVTAKDIELRGPYAKTLKKKTKNGEVIERYRDVQFDTALIPLGVCIEVPKGFESIIVPRSSTFKKLGVIETNGIGIIDQSYSSDEDEWKMPVIAMRKTTIPKGTRIAQFKVQLSQKATAWQKIKWLFSNGIKIVYVNSLSNAKRGGFGSTDSKNN